MCGAHKHVCSTHACLFAVTHTRSLIYNQQNQPQHFYLIKSSLFQLQNSHLFNLDARTAVQSSTQALRLAHANTPLYTQENPQEILNRCIRLKAPANTHSQKSFNKQPQGNNSKTSHYHCSLPLVQLFHKLIKHIALTQYPMVFLFLHLFLLLLFPFSCLSFFIHIYLSTPNTLLPTHITDYLSFCLMALLNLATAQ